MVQMNNTPLANQLMGGTTTESGTELGSSGSSAVFGSVFVDAIVINQRKGTEMGTRAESDINQVPR